MWVPPPPSPPPTFSLSPFFPSLSYLSLSLFLSSTIKEIIVDMEEMVLDMLRAFYAANRQAKPHRIIFYRDGVSEGQFKQVMLD